MARKKHLINVHTSTGTTAPTNASLYLGEIAVQHTPNDPALWIKVGSDESSTDYEKFIGETEIIELIDNSEIILGSGYTYTGLPYVNSATTIANAYSALTKEMIDNKTVVAAALNDLNGKVIELSGNTGGAETDPIFSSSVAAGITQTDIDNWNAAASGGSTDPNAITGITMNGNAVSVSNRVAGLGTVITAETQLSKGTTTGTGNVVTDLSVNNHQITLAKSFSAAPADQFVTLSGAAHNKITALSAGTISVSGFAHNKITALSAATTAHTADTTVHITAAERTAWNNKVSNVQADWSTTATTDGSYIKNKPTIPSAPGTLTTTATTAQSTATNEALTGSISLHKVSKTGSYDDLTNKPTIPTVPAWATASTKPTYTASEVGALPTGTTLDDIADGTTRKLSNYSLTSHTHNNYATTGDVNTLSSATQNIQSSAQTAYNNRITGGTITSGATNNVTVTNNSVAITAATIPSYSTADNGKVLMIQDGVPQWVIPSTITYSSSQPTGGNEGDIWIQTS